MCCLDGSIYLSDVFIYHILLRMCIAESALQNVCDIGRAENVFSLRDLSQNMNLLFICVRMCGMLIMLDSSSIDEVNFINQLLSMTCIYDIVH